MKKIISVLLIVALLFSMAACAGTAAKNDKFVGISMPTQDLQRWNQDGENMKAQLEAAGYTVDLKFPTDYPDQQAIGDYLAQNRDGFVTVAKSPGSRETPYEMDATSESHRSGQPPKGTPLR